MDAALARAIDTGSQPVIVASGKYPILKLRVGETWRVCDESKWVTLAGATASADLGSSSDYSSERLEGLSGEGFRAQVILPRLSRSLGVQAMPLIGKIPDRIR